jgi:molybdopterin converting factor small subunit
MPVTVHIPTPLRGFTAGSDRLELDGATVGEILEALVGTHQGLRRHLLQEDGRPRNFVNIYLNETDIRYLGQRETPVRPGDAITIVPSIAGGSSTSLRPGVPRRSRRFPSGDLRYSRHLLCRGRP